MRKTFVYLSPLAVVILFGVALISTLGADYKTDGRAISRIGIDLWQAMDSADQRLFSPNFITLAEDTVPWIRPVVIRNGADAERYVAISKGFIDLVNNLSHARAIDKFKPGFFQDYLGQLANESGTFPLRDLPGIAESKYWSNEILNEQQSNFNQMVALVLAMQLSHHTLGHFDSHSAELEDWYRARPINTLLNPREWNDSFRAGLKTSLATGYGVEGFEVLCEALQRMPQHPSWTNFFLPRGINFAQLEQELERSEHKFFQTVGEN